MIKWLILGGLVGIVIKEMIHNAHLYAHLYSDSLDELLKEIDDDRPRGMWELVPCTDLSEFFEGVKNGFRYRCSNCKDERRRNKRDMNFCPNCGARMFAKDINVPNKKGADDGDQ